MDKSRVEEIMLGAMERWGGRLAWVVGDREDDDYVFYIGIDELTPADEDLAVKFTVALVPEDDSARYSHAVFVIDGQSFTSLDTRLKAQVIYNRDALGVAEQAASSTVL